MEPDMRKFLDSKAVNSKGVWGLKTNLGKLEPKRHIKS